ncbi:MAG: low molecular weight phosphotyrosine protein phosphatase [Propionibacteriaceae bacterium]|jgi:protein-tyrosine phosphatase|nr:low molecular weight phosphotyrosine protein phosphatase [Propionibacteriaceae bacterium]
MSPRHVVFVCWGNICRSPMAERVAEKWAADAGLTDVVFTSAGTSAEESGHPIDDRARRLLERRGYRARGHRAHRITPADVAGADLVACMEPLHVSLLRRRFPDADNLALLTDFDPGHQGESIDDPWYGPDEAFAVTLAAIERAMPGLLNWLRA